MVDVSDELFLRLVARKEDLREAYRSSPERYLHRARFRLMDEDSLFYRVIAHHRSSEGKGGTHTLCFFKHRCSLILAERLRVKQILRTIKRKGNLTKLLEGVSPEQRLGFLVFQECAGSSAALTLAAYHYPDALPVLLAGIPPVQQIELFLYAKENRLEACMKLFLHAVLQVGDDYPAALLPALVALRWRFVRMCRTSWEEYKEQVQGQLHEKSSLFAKLMTGVAPAQLGLS